MTIFLILGISIILFFFTESVLYWRRSLSRREERDKKTMQEFVSLLVHDLRGPLDNIQKISELMLSSRQLNEKQKSEYTGLMHESAADMLILINTISDAAKLGAGRLVVQKTKNNLAQLIHERESFFALTAKQAGVSVTASYASDVPKHIIFDKRVVSDALNNLISNAIKFNRTDGWVRIDVFLKREGEDLNAEAMRSGVSWFSPTYQEGERGFGDDAVIAVSHSGPGIPAKSLPRLFRRDETVNEEFIAKIKNAHGSSLFVAKSIILHAGGAVGAGSKQGEGSTFYFTIAVNSKRA